ncbi:MAG: tyrosine-type recombinase/integrase [Eubacteriales bacterium]|nr:tyrosine-type recombinase/integrase [Eubacteriales bacterium]
MTAEAKRIIALAKDRQVMLKCESQYIFSLTEKPLSYYSITRCLKRYCKQIGIEPKLSHKIRKTFVSSLLDQHINLNTVRSIVGHTDERTTLKNYCYDRSTDAEKVLQIEKALKV